MPRIDSPFERERAAFVQYLDSQLLGPANGVDEELAESPTVRYLTGVLYPPDASAAVSTAEEDEGDSNGDDETESPISLAFERLPGSAGISFFIEGGGAFKAEVHAGQYVKLPESGTWKRHQLSERNVQFRDPGGASTERHPCFEGRAELYVVRRKLAGGYLVTATVVNTRQRVDGGLADPQDCLFQVSLKCSPLGGRIGEYRGLSRTAFEEEEEDLELLYRSRPTFAVGHGCAAIWAEPGEMVDSVSMSFIPRTVVPEMPPTKADNEVLSLQHLSDQSVRPDVLKGELAAFVAEYESWIDGIDTAARQVGGRFSRAASRVVQRLRDAALRMRAGIETLLESEVNLRAFALANRAMLMQMVHGREEYGGGARARNERAYAAPDYSGAAWRDLRWRPFQLAFQLLVLPSLVDFDDAHRGTVDLIWFPTGGGKTEAYLGLAAFEMFRRRLTQGAAGEGTAVIKRYTLRLLTSQQFQRAAALVCACEQLRRIDRSLGGPFRLGLWVGDEATPNRFTDSHHPGGAVERLARLLDEEEPENPFQLTKCPWCGTRIVPTRRDARDCYGVDASATSFRLFCPSDRCPFHDELPVSVVDEDLYQRPPSFVVATVDKFARLAWDARPGAFFGIGGAVSPPSLIIQDELHLISGPLGTIAGAYEAAIDTVVAGLGPPPKVIAATATIRRAQDQVRKLYGRDVAVFPPSGLDADDSYFARVDRTRPGRLYVGVMAAGHTPVTSLVRTAAALAEGASAVTMGEECRDGYWTQLIYHNSRRELGKTMTLARDDIPARVLVIARDAARARSLDNVVELSANVSGKRIPMVLDQLQKSRGSGEAIDILPCTSMISVGVDVKRLGLMLVNGQPKTTSEYIQATSRVGRHVVPGLVVTLYSPTKPRDRSHYEDFVSYHSSLYKWVEPTSVTPWAKPARDRTLHAALVILARHVGGLPDNGDAERMRIDDPRLLGLIDRLMTRVTRSDDAESAATRQHAEALLREWASHIKAAADSATPLRYDSQGSRQFAALLCQYDDRSVGLWPTLNSMRHVDVSCLVHVDGERR